MLWVNTCGINFFYCCLCKRQVLCINIQQLIYIPSLTYFTSLVQCNEIAIHMVHFICTVYWMDPYVPIYQQIGFSLPSRGEFNISLLIHKRISTSDISSPNIPNISTIFFFSLHGPLSPYYIWVTPGIEYIGNHFIGRYMHAHIRACIIVCNVRSCYACYEWVYSEWLLICWKLVCSIGNV